MPIPEERRALIEYLRVKLDKGDWHAVRDAACDLEVLDAVAASMPPKVEVWSGGSGPMTGSGGGSYPGSPK